MQLVWSSGFARSLKRFQRQRPQFKPSIAQTLDQLERDPFHPSLHTHKLKGSLADRYACSINYADRILFRFG
jgi:mRNA-degrading endonuclease YafQ of YafQ-DinJ toxin-antitoxin module